MCADVYGAFEDRKRFELASTVLTRHWQCAQHTRIGGDSRQSVLQVRGFDDSATQVQTSAAHSKDNDGAT